MKIKALVLTLASSAATFAVAGPVDLTTWTAEGASSWTVASPPDSVFQTVNGPPTVFYSDFNGQGKKLSGKITVETSSDNDFIGFALGFQPGDVSAPSTDFILVDWKQQTQSFFGCNGNIGLAISRVSGGLPDAAGTWCHNNNLTELARATNLGTTGWADYTTYDFDLVFTTSQIQVFVDGVKEIDISGSFNNGRFGFYNYSQTNVRYAAIEEDDAPPPTNNVPEPMSLFLVATALLGLGATRRKK